MCLMTSKLWRRCLLHHSCTVAMGRYWFLFAGHGETILFSEIFLCSFAAVCWNFLQKFLLSSSKIRQLQGNLQRR